MRPTAQHERYRFLDVLRGVALLGILPANMPFYGLPSIGFSEPHVVTDSGWAEPLAYYLTSFFVDYKFITIFSLLFGVGLALIHQRCVVAGRSFRRLYVRRIGVLAVFAALHVVLLWMGDILSYYTFLGFVAMWLANLPARRLRQLGIVVLCVPAVVLLFASTFLAVTQDTPELHSALQEFREFEPRPLPAEGISHLPLLDRLEYYGPELERRVYGRGDFWEIASFRVQHWLVGLVVLGSYFGWRILGLFLIGMSLLKSGRFVRPAEHWKSFRKIGRAGFTVGIPLQLASLVLSVTGAGWMAGSCLAEGLQYVGSLGMSAGYLALVAWLFAKIRAVAWSQRFAAVGQTALSNYILHSVVCSLLFYSYGLGMFCRLDRLQLWLVVAVIWPLQLLLSPWWLKRFRFGPLEWLWRMLTYGQRVPLRRA